MWSTARAIPSGAQCPLLAAAPSDRRVRGRAGGRCCYGLRPACKFVKRCR